MDRTLLIGIVGGLILVSGAAWPDRPVSHPARSLKNWLFAIGGAVMLAYSTLNYLAGGPIFFLFLQILVNLSSVFMMLNVPDTLDTPILVVAALGLISWSLVLFEGYETIAFIVGLAGIGMGYAMDTGSLRRELSLTGGSALIALFSYLTATWVFFWLNVFFALFSGYHAWRMGVAAHGRAHGALVHA